MRYEKRARGARNIKPHISFLISHILFLFFALAPLVASAHAQVISSTPADGSSVPAGLKTITIRFSEDVSPDQSVATVIGPDGGAIKDVAVVVDRANRTLMNIYTQPLVEGKYTVEWAAVTENDNGRTSGRFSFTVTGSAATIPNTGTTATPTDATPDPPVTWPGQGWLIAGSALATLLLALAIWTILRRRV